MTIIEQFQTFCSINITIIFACMTIRLYNTSLVRQFACKAIRLYNSSLEEYLLEQQKKIARATIRYINIR